MAAKLIQNLGPVVMRRRIAGLEPRRNHESLQRIIDSAGAVMEQAEPVVTHRIARRLCHRFRHRFSASPLDDGLRLLQALVRLTRSAKPRGRRSASVAGYSSVTQPWEASLTFLMYL